MQGTVSDTCDAAGQKSLSPLLSFKLFCQTGACSLHNPADQSTLAPGTHVQGTERHTQSVSLGGHTPELSHCTFLRQGNQLAEGWIGQFSL